ncbi:tetratricopeptide repeat-containing sensor histidine kinase [Ekhidna sp.]
MRILITVFFLQAKLIFCQSPVLIDSLKNELTSNPDSIKQILLTDLAWEYAYSNIDSAKYYGLEALKLANKRNNLNDIARSKSMLAIVYDINGEVRDAAKLYVEVAKYYESINDVAELSKAYNNLGVLFYYNGDYTKSDEYFLKSMTIDEKLGDSLGVASSLINLAAISNYSDDYAQSFQYLRKAEKIALNLPKSDIISSVYEELATTYAYAEVYDSSILYIKKSLPTHKASNDIHSVLSSYNGLITAYYSLKNYDSALYYFAEAQNLANGYDDITIRSSRYRLGSSIYAAINDFENAYKFQLKYQADNDSIRSSDRAKALNELEEKYQSEQKEIEISKLQVEQQKSQNQRNVLLLVSASVILGAILLFALVRSKSKANKIIAKSLDEKETLLKEIHHRVKNNLQVVSSLLSMQSRFITDENALGAVNEGQTRVESMALIHQKLYQENNLSGVYAKEYIEDLAEILKQSYTTGADIDFKYEIDELLIDVDTIIPIGLILNELICNSLKHAFPDNEEGVIQVSLKEEESELKLKVSDNGVGSSGSATGESFGMVLIESLAMKLKASLETTNQNGTSTLLSIKKYKLV